MEANITDFYKIFLNSLSKTETFMKFLLKKYFTFQQNCGF
jgi:hypothetical protein